ncbi:hypothetical protein [Mucilaginibacter paludis]|uniref:Uncharacterized protein n=1 Tax=Mucilaginibacter paludis DSM 18603 TaxID=714943 RepID=H1Y661_9SPHI|nr:hypothetical protein [Mucilaginibacter paludis]EHQ31020.1 hypothetical protein Mucpa_6973 [Mucilaginibacter paludis DSM 18603]
MKTLKFNFTHPVKGHAQIIMPGWPNFPLKQLLLDSKASNLVEIPLMGFRDGKYKVTLDWEADNKFFIHQEEFEINDNPNFIPATR